MFSLRVDNDRLNKLVKDGHVSSSDNNSETVVELTDGNTALHQPASDQKLSPDLDDLSFPAKSLGINWLLNQIKSIHS